MLGGAAVLGAGMALNCETTKNAIDYVFNPAYVKSFADKSYLIEAAGLTALVTAPFALAYKKIIGQKNNENSRD